jgi:hypothetical protein
MNRPKSESQAGRLLRLLESAKGQRVSLVDILSLRISQYGARIHDLRHKHGFRIESGSMPGRHDHTWFRLASAVALGGKYGSRPVGAEPENKGDTPLLIPVREYHKDDLN